MFENLVIWLVDFVHHFGYLGIFIMTFLESTFVPVPSEVTMIPAGYLIHEGIWSWWMVLFCSISGTILGSLANYMLAYHLGRPFFIRYGRYVLCDAKRIEQIDKYFRSHGEISIFTGRLIPGVRHVISFPAGLTHMNLKHFCGLTALGGGLWMATLTLVGYLIGGNKDLVKHYMPYITGAFIIGVTVLITLYVIRHRKKTGKDNGVV